MGKKYKFWWWEKCDGYVPLFSSETLRITKLYTFPDIFGNSIMKMDYDQWLAIREQLWAIQEKLC